MVAHSIKVVRGETMADENDTNSSGHSSAIYPSLPDDFEQNVELLYNDVASIRTFASNKRQGGPKQKGSKTKKKKGPKPSTVKLKIYHLPPGSAKPKFSKPDETVHLHMRCGYGFPKQCYQVGGNGKVKFTSLPLGVD
eukprot:TCONS_00028989-protein